MKNKKKNVRHWLIALLSLIVILPAAGVLMTRFEGERPGAELDLPSPYVGVSRELGVTVSDRKSGLRKIRIDVLQKGRETVLVEESFPSKGFLGQGEVHAHRLTVSIDPKKSGIGDGPAVLRVAVRDHSWRGGGKGNLALVEKEIVIDTRAPEITVLTRAHNVSQGGTGLIVYRLSEPCRSSGVRVGDAVFPGYTGHFKDGSVALAFFALRHDQGPGTPLSVTATDEAGNTARAGFPHYIRKKAFREDTITVTDRFLEWKLPEFGATLSATGTASRSEQFLQVNRNLRAANYNRLRELARATENRLLWDGAFLRLPGSARQAGFGDHRTYFYKGRAIDRQTHLGIDLASVAASAVPAANSGVVAFSRSLGIYGKTVVIDHGFGLFSMYAHLSRLAVKEKETVARGDIIGNTGTTGLAGGDHLHFSIFVDHVFVNPVEWWDRAWIHNNVDTKLATVERSLGN